MKQIRLIPIGMVCAVVACLFVSCASDDVGVVEKSDKALVLNGGILSVKPIEMKTRGISFTTAPMNPDSIIEGEYTITAEDATRTPVNDNNWAGIDGNRDIAVQIGDGTAPYKYSVDAAGKLTSANPYYITTANNFTVKSWYPYTSTALSASGFTVQSNQSSIANLQKSDLLFSTNTAVNVSNSANNMTYTHATARLIVKVVSTKANYMLNQGIPTSITFTGAKLSSSVSTSGVLTATGSASEVSMYKLNSSVSNNVATTYYVACIPPQSAKLSINVFIHNMKYTATMGSNGTFVAGKGNEITVNINSSRVYISSGNTIEVGDYYCSSTSGQAWVVKTINLASAQSSYGASPIAVIFSTATSATDQNHGWRLGYAMALQNATTNNGTNGTCIWGPISDNGGLTNWDNADPRTTWVLNKEGYTETWTIGKNSDYPAFYYAIDYDNTVAAPNVSSKWYLPSNGQWYDIIVNLGKGNPNETYVNEGGTKDLDEIVWGFNPSRLELLQAEINSYMYSVQNYASIFPIDYIEHRISGGANGEYFWCSSERRSDIAYHQFFRNDGCVVVIAVTHAKKNAINYRVRPVLAF